ncbi:aminopeptidase P family protein [Candidatus Peregrinibacteria bacterium]|nr:aminopeptidase P family protein [Candidatus Peregrinibacteria bacterium]
MSETLMKNGSKALYITGEKNIQYLTGFTGSYGSILLTKKKIFFFTDSRYFEEARSSIRLFGAFSSDKKNESYKEVYKKLKNLGCDGEIEFVQFKKHGDHPLPALLKKEKIKIMQFEKNHMSYGGYENLKKLLKGIKLIPTSGVIELLRSIKTKQEIEYIEKAQHITEKILETLKKTIRIGQSEKEIDQKIRYLGDEFGACGMAFDPIVGFGQSSAIPHHRNSTKEVKSVTIPFIATNEEGADKDEVYVNGEESDGNNEGIFGTAGDLEKIVRNFLKKQGYEQYFTHALGHGVGLEIHESPSLSEKIGTQKKPQILKENMLITIEPGIYLKEKFGIRLENIYQVTKSGAKNLNLSSLEITENLLNLP